ncbi:hypothetical protein RF11_09348 [Thelohanellus kitauei]|uniref:Uncharacterized protein n=1 Tax=Thelohanellus kitauei TaxID=669202 RepID=A0A0C2M3U9_THEKT|nr:hypothetical protein RF11_09348 [Thelohanellus kitauei]
MVSTVHRKYPNMFEFKESLLDVLASNLYSGYFFPFAHPSYAGKIFHQPENIFDEILSQKSIFVNNEYDDSILLCFVNQKSFADLLKIPKLRGKCSKGFYEFSELWNLKLTKFTQLSEMLFMFNKNQGDKSCDNDEKDENPHTQTINL